jgi:hypothetical protein
MLGKEREAELRRTAERTRRKEMDSNWVRPKGAAAAGLAAMLATLVVLVAAASSQAAPNLTKQQWTKQADALCAAAIAKNNKYNPLYPAAKAAAVGDKVVAVNRRTMRSLHALQPPEAEKASVGRLLALGDAAVGGVARAVAAAKSGNEQSFVTAARRAQALIVKAHAAARAYGLQACARW